MFELFIAPVKAGSGIWENKELTSIGNVDVCLKNLGRVRYADIVPKLRDVKLEPLTYEVWAKRGVMYHFLFFFEGERLCQQ